MPKLRSISGNDLSKLLLSKGFVVLRQKGSHVRMVWQSADKKVFLTIPIHSEIDRGTLRSIMRTSEKCLSAEEILEIFYK